jgi:ubiquinone/menaquinone biosynthesis C-methylase UbiE
MAEHVCPVWVGYFTILPIRKLLQNPSKILGAYIKPRMTTLDLGSAMGFFSLPMAKMVGPGGQVICVDVQPKMLDVLARRAVKAGLFDRIETHLCRLESLDLQGRNASVDFALAFAALHEVPDQTRCLGELCQLLKAHAALLLVEPVKHVTASEFDQSVARAKEIGFVPGERPHIRWSHAVLLTKPDVRSDEPPSAPADAPDES